MLYIVNEFSVDMLTTDMIGVNVRFRDMTLNEVHTHLHVAHHIWTSAILDADMARILSYWLMKNIKPNRIKVKLSSFDTVLVCHYDGPKLPEGATKLPDGTEFRFFMFYLA